MRLGGLPRPLRASQGSPWTSRSDRVVALGIALAVVAALLLVWSTSESRATESTTAAPPAPLPAPAGFPPELKEIWHAPNAQSPVPVADGASVVTGDGSTVTGRDALTGKPRWHYARNLPLCTLGEGWSRALAVFRHNDDCDEVTEFDMGTGKRTAQRTGDGESQTSLLSDSSNVLATGTKFLSAWSQDLIQTMEYGTVPAPLNPGRQPRPGCTYSSEVIDGGRVAVIEHCRADGTARLTVVQTNNDDEGADTDQPKIACSVRVGSDKARVVAMTGGDRSTVALTSPDSSDLSIYRAPKVPVAKQSPDGETPATAPEKPCVKQAGYQVGLSPQDLGADTGVAVRPKRIDDTVYWHAGTSTVALASKTLKPRWIMHDTLGTPVLFAGQTLMPTRAGLSVIDPATGRPERQLPLRRPPVASVQLAAIGPVLLEQRGNQVVALR